MFRFEKLDVWHRAIDFAKQLSRMLSGLRTKLLSTS